jgi:putative endonuclease
MPSTAHVYILASRRRGTLCTGVASNLVGRVHQHSEHLLDGFTSKHGVTRIVWYVHGEDISAAIELEKKIRNRGRQWKIDLIETENPDRNDLAAAWTNSDPATSRKVTRQHAESALQAKCNENTQPHASRWPA